MMNPIISILFLCFSFSYGVYVPVTPTIPPAYNYPTLPSVGSQSQSVIRSLDGNSVFSSYSKAVDTPHSSVRKYDSRVNNDAIVYAPYPTAPYPAVASYSAPAPLYHKAAPVYHYTAPSYYTPQTYHPYSAPVYSAPAPAVYHHPSALYHAPSPFYHSAVKPVAIHAPGAHYSDAAAVSHLTFEGLGAHYEW